MTTQSDEAEYPQVAAAKILATSIDALTKVLTPKPETVEPKRETLTEEQREEIGTFLAFADYREHAFRLGTDDIAAVQTRIRTIIERGIGFSLTGERE